MPNRKPAVSPARSEMRDTRSPLANATRTRRPRQFIESQGDTRDGAQGAVLIVGLFVVGVLIVGLMSMAA